MDSCRAVWVSGERVFQEEYAARVCADMLQVMRPAGAEGRGKQGGQEEGMVARGQSLWVGLLGVVKSVDVILVDEKFLGVWSKC